jgi:heat shock protein HslJ
MNPKHFKRQWGVLLVVLSLVLAGCQEEATPTPAPTVPSPTPAAPEMAAPEMAALQNMTYKIDTTQSGEAPLTDGEYRESVAPGSATETVVTMTDHVAFGELSDGEPAAAVVLTSDPGGSGTFYYLAVVKLRNGQPVNVATTGLGDRVQMQSVAIRNGEIVVDMVAHGPEDPMCCPTQRVVQNYSLQGAELVQTSSQVVGATEPEEVPEISQPMYRWGEVADRLWVLVGYGDALNPTVVEEGTKITAVFSSVEPTVNGSGGCNNYFAGYASTDDGGLTIEGPIGSTRMACETGLDQETAYFGALETVTNWAINEQGRLELTYSTGQPYEEKLIYAPGEAPLVGTTWRLVSYGDPEDPTAVEKGTAITAVFSPETDTTGTMSGSATCNSYTTGYTLDGDQISFGPIAGTMMMCPVGADQETAYLAALETAGTFEILGPNLQITYDDGVLNYTSLNLPLEYALWQAVTILGDPVPEGAMITAIFTPGEEEGEGSVGGNAVCNSYSAGYETDGESLTIVGPIAMTMAFCPDEALNRVEQAYMGALEKAESYEILGDQMVLHTQDGEILYAANREPLEGTLWTLISIGPPNEPRPPVEGSHFTAQFSRLPELPSGTVEGTTGCNDWNATYTANLTEIKINLPTKTQNEDCPWGTGNYEVEQQFFLGLNAATEYRIVGNVLQVPYGEGESMQVMNFQATQPPVEEVLDLTPLDNTTWFLAAMGDQPVLPDSEVAVAFEINADGVTGQISGSGGCNSFNAAIGEGFAIGPIASTRMACEQAVMDQESAFFAWLGTAYHYSQAGDQLLISTGEGVLTFNSQR